MWYKSAQFKSIVTMARFNQQILKFTKRLCKSSRYSQKTTLNYGYLCCQSSLPCTYIYKVSSLYHEVFDHPANDQWKKQISILLKKTSQKLTNIWKVLQSNCNRQQITNVCSFPFSVSQCTQSPQSNYLSCMSLQNAKRQCSIAKVF